MGPNCVLPRGASVEGYVSEKVGCDFWKLSLEWIAPGE
jgi:hypothetical protein